MRRKLFVLALILVGVVGVGAVYRSRTADKPRFQTAAITRGSIVDAVEATGTLEPVDPVQVGSQVTGTVVSLGTDFNQRVKKGQVVAMLDPALFQAQVDQAQATVSRLQAELERARVQLADSKQKLARAEALAREKLIPQQDLDAAAILADANQAALKSAEAQLVQAQASLEQAKVNLGHTIIRAPDEGIVLSRAVEIGQTVSAGLQTPTLFVIARDLGTMRVNASVDESDIGRVHEGQTVHFTVDAYGQEQFAGKVTEVRLQPTVTQGVVSYPTVIEVPNQDLRLKPGMTATVSIEVARQDDVLRIPVSALRFRPTPEQRGEKSTGETTRANRGEGGERAARAGGGADGGGWNGAGGNGPAGNAMASRQPGAARAPMAGMADSRVANGGGGAGRWARANNAGFGGGAGAGAGANGSAVTPGQTRVVWQLVDDQLKPVRVRVGLANATHAALVEGSLDEGAEVVTGIAQPNTATQTTTSSPLMPNMPRRGPGGGGPGGSGGRR